ncbi:MAG: hypothetical protein HZC02_01080 [Candidatus Levybacteria bacterium]|nr:hypothetical protein [Candidatus Levybacteria bacterium]
MRVNIDGKAISLNPSQSIGQGGEADVYLDSNRAIKIFKPPTHKDFDGLPQAQKKAAERLVRMQTKLADFPSGLPSKVVTPQSIVTDTSGNKIIGYTMAFMPDTEVLLRYAEKGFRIPGIPQQTVVDIFRDMHPTVLGIHRQQVVIGDFNDLNVLVKGTDGFFIDVDSFQFGKYPCLAYTQRFGDPLLMRETTIAERKEKMGYFTLAKPHNELSDWYAFSIMLMQSLLFVDPYGGVYIPKTPADQFTDPERLMHRITVFHPQVRYPKPAIPLGVLPDPLLDMFQRIFEKDHRGIFPLSLLEEMHWTTCTKCGAEHARPVCPECSHAAPAAVKAVVTIRGNVIATRMFQTTGHIVFASSQGGKLVWLYHENGSYRRENKEAVLKGSFDPFMRYRIQSNRTLFGKNGQLITIAPDKTPQRLQVDSFDKLPIFDANETTRYWVANGQLLRDTTDLGVFSEGLSTTIGNVMDHQTLFWVGKTFGFGFYRVGELTVAFVFDAKQQGINDSVKLRISGRLVDSTCVFSSTHCWFFTKTVEQGRTINRCTAINRNGTIEATIEVDDGEDSWLGKIRGKCATGNVLYSSTDTGIVRVEVDQERIFVAKTYPDTEPYVSEDTNLFVGRGCIYATTDKEVYELKFT